MKKLLILLMMVAMVSFLFAGCFLEPNDDEDEPGEPGICPVVSITSEAEVGGKKYIGIGEQTITVTFAVPTEPVSVYVGASLRLSLEELLQTEVVMYPNDDKTVYIGDFSFGTGVGIGEFEGIFSYPDCSEAYIYVGTCETCDYCKYPYTVDKEPPYANVEITSKEVCDGFSIKFNSAWTEENGEYPCESLGGCCGDECSGLTSWKIEIYDRELLDECGDVDPCAKLLYSSEGTACPILWETGCIEGWYLSDFYVIIELEDVVGNTTEDLAFNLPTERVEIGGGCPD